ncbi:MAG: hypothetical protein PHF64_09880 [Methanoregula sp.]|nr:hypothetical protein [Methanoregula sp.]
MKYDPDSVRELSQTVGDFLGLYLEFFEIRTNTTLRRSHQLLEEFFLATNNHCIRKLE